MKTRLFILLTVTTLFSGSLLAQATRTWVSGVGDDVNPCSRTAPCKTFAGAISKTAIGGEINAIDSGGFGALTITKSITIDGTGVHASILGSGTNGVNINIAISANDPLRRVVLRNISINGTGMSGSVGTNTGLNGVNIHTNGATSVILDRVTIGNFNKGVVAAPSANQTNLYMTNVDVTNCSTNGVAIQPTSTATVRAELDNVRVARTGSTTAHDGILVGAAAAVHLNSVSVFGSGGNGYRVNGGSATTIDRSTFMKNGAAGVLVDNAGALLAVGGSAATQNAAGGFRANSGLILSYRNNQSSNNVLADTANTQQGFY
jgi:hypothetical protein